MPQTIDEMKDWLRSIMNTPRPQGNPGEPWKNDAAANASFQRLFGPSAQPTRLPSADAGVDILRETPDEAAFRVRPRSATYGEDIALPSEKKPVQLKKPGGQ